MKRTIGSSPLNDEQQQHYVDNFGTRYHAIAENPLRQSRAVRRAEKFRGKRHAAGLGPVDAELARRQHEMAERLAAANVRPA